MYRIGIDVGSSFTKYCVMIDGEIRELFEEKTPIRQIEYFEAKTRELLAKYPKAEIVSCGYGRSNVSGIRNINELTALAKGAYWSSGEDGLILDVGGQDSKLIYQKQGKLREFFVNDKCAAGSGLFLSSVLDMIGIGFDEVELLIDENKASGLSSTCAVFAQSEIVEMIADNCSEGEIVSSVLHQIFVKAKQLLVKAEGEPLLLTGGLSQIEGIGGFAEKILGRKCIVGDYGAYLASIGCAI